MAKITDESRGIFTAKAAPYKEVIKKITEKEKNILSLIPREVTGVGYKRIMLCEEMIYASTILMTINNLSVEILETKNEDSLNDARKSLYKAVIYLEETVTNYIDAAFSEYESKLSDIINMPFEKRYYLIRKLGLAIDMLIEAYGANSKWKWAFVELWGRFSTVAKNLVDMSSATKAYFDSRSEDFDSTVYYFRMLKKFLQKSADGYRDRYELSTRRLDDIRLGINYLNAYRRILILLDERENAEEIKKKAAVWKSKMEADQKAAAK